MARSNSYLKKLKESLPSVRERLTAAAILLAISVTIMASATFAWVALSTHPELNGVAMTIAGNGNLEIALRNEMDDMPDPSQIGDSVAAGTAVKDANIKWGNLINLSEGYGLEGLTLRPAILNETGLQSGTPLWGAAYTPDGRVEKLQSDFAFTVWEDGQNGAMGAFKVPAVMKYGVRAISSVRYENLSSSRVLVYMEAADERNMKAGSTYTTLTDNDDYMASITGLMGDFMTWRLDDGVTEEQKICDPYIEPMYHMLMDLKQAFQEAGEAMVLLINAQQLKMGGDQYNEADNYTYADLLSGKALPSGTSVYGVDVFRKAMNGSGSTPGLLADIETLGMLKKRLDDNAGSVLFKEIEPLVNRTVHINTSRIRNGSGVEYPVSGIGARVAIANYMGNDVKSAYIQKGYLYDFEYLTGTHMRVEGVSVTVNYVTKVEMKAVVMTERYRTDLSVSPPYFTQSFNATKNAAGADANKGTAIAADTYGLAMDFWVRTNAAGSMLALNGAVRVQEERIPAVGTVGGETVDLYTITVKQTVTQENGSTEEIDVLMEVYSRTENGQTVWYSYATNEPAEIPEGATPSRKYDIKEIVTNFEGDNRVWEDNPLLTDKSTTQGNGSCYIYYADTPEDSAKSLELLKHMKVVFVDGANRKLAVASMDTDHVFQVNGKYTVPLVITESNYFYTFTNKYGVEESRGAIMQLNQNEATRLTAILYLDGSTLSNDQVLSTSDIQGYLNLQFSSTVDLESMEDRALQDEKVSVSATIDKRQFNFDLEDNLKGNVTIDVSGMEPEHVEIFFQRVITSTQGSRMQSITMQPVDGVWTGEYDFGLPGKYVLRSVRLDGVEYPLDEPIEVLVEGFTVSSISCDSTYILTAQSTATAGVTLSFASDKKLPSTVQGRFIAEDGDSVTVNFIKDTTRAVYTGTATFAESGIYTLEYLVLDGKYEPVAPALQQIVEVRLGISTRIWINRTGANFGQSLNFIFAGAEDLNAEAVIVDDTGAELTGETGIKLFYGKRGAVGSSGGLDTDMTWDSSKNRYVGTFPLRSAGSYSFSYLSVAGNVINKANQPPVITAVSPDPPSMEGVTYPTDVVFAITGDSAGNVDFELANSAGASIEAVFSNGIRTIRVAGVEGDSRDVNGVQVSAWRFPIREAGKWTLQSLEAWDVYDRAGHYYTGGSDVYEITVRDASNITVTVVTQIITTFGNDVTLGKTDGTVTGTFLQQQNFYPTAKIEPNFTNEEIRQLLAGSTMELEFQWIGSTANSYGGYTTTTTVAPIVITITADAQGNMTTTTPAVLQVAGQYRLNSAKVTILGTTSNITLPSENLRYSAHVYSVAPSVALKATTPSGGHNGCQSGTTLKSVTSGISGNTATVYYSASNSKDCFNNTTVNYSQPTVTITLSGLGGGKSATLDFGTLNSGKLHTSGGTTGATTSFYWEANGDSKRWIGDYESKSAASDTRVATGKITASVLTLTADGFSGNFTVDIPDIIINNPY